jgi:ribonuclease R
MQGAMMSAASDESSDDPIEVSGFTIDDKSTRDIDDAVWLKPTSNGGAIVYVSIADVARTITVGSPEDHGARERVVTRYFQNGNKPMLPRLLSEDLLSLVPKKERHTITVEVHLNQSLEEEHASVYFSRLRSTDKLAYSDVPTILGYKDHPSYDVISRMSVVALGLCERRREAGALVLYDLNSGWVTTEEGQLRQLERREDTIGQIIIQELMILANRAIANWCIEHDVVVPFRNHTIRTAAPSRDELLAQLETALTVGMPAEQLDSLRQRTHMLLDKAEYGAAVLGHYGLNAPTYVHFTSPIRRYADLVLHRQVRSKLQKRPAPYEKHDIAEVCGYINRTLRQEMKSRQQAEKKRADTRAKATPPANLERVSDKEFERIIKVRARATAPDPNAQKDFETALLARLRSDRLPPASMALALFEARSAPDDWKPVWSAILQRLVEKSEHAMSIMTIGSSLYGWQRPSFDTTQSGEAHLPVFHTNAVLAGIPFGTEKRSLTARSVAYSKKHSLALATIELLAAIVGMPAPKSPVARPISEIAQASPKTDNEVMRPGQNPVSALMEYCQQRALEPPHFTFEQNGPAHMPTIVCRVRFGTMEKSASANNKAEAKKLAAQAIVELLS